jgi:hypothetical protein
MATILRIQVDDDTLAKLQQVADYQRKDLESVAASACKSATNHLPPGGRYVVIGGEALETLEKILGGGSLLNAADLSKKVSRLAGVSFLHIRLPFTPNQLETLRDKAERNSLTVEQLVERTAPRIYEQFFDLVARV